MAGSPADRRISRRDRASHDDRQQRLIYLGAGGILLLVLLIVAVGVVMTVILPPRAHVLTVGDAEFSARDVADRAIYLVSTGNGNAQQDPAGEAIDSLIGQEILFQVGAPLVAEVTDQDVKDAIARRLGLNVPAPQDAAATATETPTETPTGTATETAVGSATAESTETPAATNTPAPEATRYTDQEYADALAEYLRVAPIGRSALEDIIRAGLIEDRLTEQFRAELPETGDQLQLWAVPTNDRAAAQKLVDLVRGGASFRGAAVEAGIIDNPDTGVQDLGWFAPTSLNDRVAPFIADLQAGQVSDVVDDANKIGYEVFFVAERSSDLPYQDAVKDQLAARAFNEWKDEQEATLKIERDLSDGKERWIRDQVTGYLGG